MANMKFFYEVEVKAIDESVVCFLHEKNETQRSGMLSLDVSEAEEFVELLNSSISKAKESEYYQA